MRALNAFRWDGKAGHYEVYYLTLTDGASGVGVWIRYTMLAPVPGSGEPSASLWLLAMDPGGASAPTLGRKATLPIEQLRAQDQPFELRIAEAVLREDGMSGAFEDVSWELRWAPSATEYEHVHRIIQTTRAAKTIYVLPQADLSIDGTVSFAGRTLELAGARGGQAHLWGSKHASSWAWAHCNDFRTIEGQPSPGDVVDGVSAFVPRFGRELGPNTPVVGSIGGRDFRSTSPLRVVRNVSTFSLTEWHFEAVDGARKLIADVTADRDQLAGVTYHDPDGEHAYCYNSETASMRVEVYERSRGDWIHASTLVADGRAHFEYAQRAPLPDLELHTT
jgi:hypothetical protein